MIVEHITLQKVLGGAEVQQPGLRVDVHNFTHHSVLSSFSQMNQSGLVNPTSVLVFDKCPTLA